MGYLVLPDELTQSNYYKWILSSNDKIILQTLCRKSLNKGTKYYANSMIVTNIKLTTLSFASGIPYSTARDCINKLNYLGIAIKLPKKARNNRYFLGFRTQGDKKLYLIDNLITETKANLDMTIENQMEEFGKKHETPLIQDLASYKLHSDYIDFITDHCDKPNEFLNKRLKNNQTIFELLFNRSDVYRKLLPNKPVLMASVAPQMATTAT